MNKKYHSLVTVPVNTYIYTGGRIFFARGRLVKMKDAPFAPYMCKKRQKRVKKTP